MDDPYFDDATEEENDEEEELDPNNPEHVFLIIERDFNKTVAEIEQNPDTVQYAEDFYKMFDNYFQSHQKEKLLITKCDELTKLIDDRNHKLDIATKLAITDQTTINELKSQIDHAWRLADAAHLREQAAQEIIDNLRKQVETLSTELDFKNKMGQDNAEELGQMSKRKEGLERENEKLVQEVTQLSQKLTNALEYQTELERKNSSADLKIVEITEVLEENNNEIEKQKKIREQLENDLSQLQYKIEDKEIHVNNLNAVINDHLKHIGKLDNIIKDEKLAKEKVIKELENYTNKHTKLIDDYTNLQGDLDVSKKNFSHKVSELKEKEEEITRLKNDSSKISKIRDSLEKKVFGLEGEKSELLEDRSKLRQRISVYEREIESLKRQQDMDKRSLETVNKEKDQLGKSLIRQEAVAADQQKLIKIQQHGKKKLESEVDSLTIERYKQVKMINSLERERDRLTEDHLTLNTKIEELTDDLKLKKVEIYELKKTIDDQENKFKVQQNLFDTIRADRNALQKALQESSSQAGELKKKIKIISHQVDQLKEDISIKEQLLIKEENIFKKVLKEKENLKVDLNVAQNLIRNLKNEIAEKNAEEKRLHKTILDNEKVIKDQKNDLDQLMNERDILGSQLVRRNDEIVLLHEKIRILQTTLQRGESQYQQRLEDIRLLKIEIRRLRQEKNLMSKTIDNSVNLRQEILFLERDLTRSRLKCRALEEELQNPLNIHRWRKLEGSDPHAMELLEKVQLLQKRLLKQSSEAIEREKQLKEVEILYLNLKKLLAHQPDPSIHEELVKTKKLLKFKSDKLKCLISELNMAELKATEYRSDLQRVKDELNELKKKYFAEKKLNRPLKLAHESAKELDRIHSNNRQPTSQVKFNGGGYRMSVQNL